MKFDSFDADVIAALMAASPQEELATFGEIRFHHPGPLPPQRLMGMAKRGLLIFNGREWLLTGEARAAFWDYMRENYEAMQDMLAGDAEEYAELEAEEALEGC